jgi:hypothetical protein
MKNALLILTLFCASHLSAQKMYSTKSGQVKFNASSPLETIRAVNNQGDSRWLESNGQLVFSVLIKGFKFENQLMEDHFNENYMESSKFPKAEFKGYINDLQRLDLTKAGANECGRNTYHTWCESENDGKWHTNRFE